jgi:hypothetical protein
VDSGIFVIAGSEGQGFLLPFISIIKASILIWTEHDERIIVK